MCTSEILSRLNTIENLLKKLIEHDHQETSKPLTFKEACAYLGYTQSYLYKLTYKKIIPHYKPTGKMIFFSKNEIDEWVYKNAEGKGRGAGNTSTTLGIKDTNQFGIKDPNAPRFDLVHRVEAGQIEMELNCDEKTKDEKGRSISNKSNAGVSSSASFSDSHRTIKKSRLHAKARKSKVNNGIQKDDSESEVIIEFPLKSRRKQ